MVFFNPTPLPIMPKPQPCNGEVKKKKKMCGPRISIARMRFPLDGELEFYFEKLIFIDYLKMTWSRHLFLFYF